MPRYLLNLTSIIFYPWVSWPSLLSMDLSGFSPIHLSPESSCTLFPFSGLHVCISVWGGVSGHAPPVVLEGLLPGEITP